MKLARRELSYRLTWNDRENSSLGSLSDLYWLLIALLSNTGYLLWSHSELKLNWVLCAGEHYTLHVLIMVKHFEKVKHCPNSKLLFSVGVNLYLENNTDKAVRPWERCFTDLSRMCSVFYIITAKQLQRLLIVQPGNLFFHFLREDTRSLLWL